MTSIANTPIKQCDHLDENTFHYITTQSFEPVVIRGFVSQWPSVKLAMQSADKLCEYLAAIDSGVPTDTLLLHPDEDGAVFYNKEMDGFNYARKRITISQALEQIARYSHFDRPPAIAVQSALIKECLPAFINEHSVPWLNTEIAPRIWMGNKTLTPAHFDESHNIACVVAGKRRFTLFPPEQISNLYIGPVDFAPTGTPLSLARLHKLDEEKFPRAKIALEHAQTADLEPGDAIYIPPLWWHQVESLTILNILVNYWWKPVTSTGYVHESVLSAMTHCMLTIRHLPAKQRKAWQVFFEYYLFSDNSATEHIPPERLGILGEMTPELAAQIKAMLIQRLQDK